MSKCCTGDYKYKGFLIGFSEYYQEWILEPYYLGDSLDATNFEIEYANNSEGFNTIKEAKAYIRENYDELITDCNKRFKEYCEKGAYH